MTLGRPLGAQLAHLLKARGVRHVFGIPGVHNQELYRGIEEAGLIHVLARHEQGAGFMADGYARATGEPGVALVISGPGLTNIMTPLGQAWSDSVPVLALSSCLDETSARKGQLHQMRDQQGAAATVCDWSETARNADAAYALVDRAFVEFRSTRPRPKHISVPISVLEAQARGFGPAPGVPAPRSVDPDDLNTAVDALNAAERPLVIVGGGAVAAGAPLAKLLGRLQAASFMTYAGRGVIAPDTEFCFGSMLGRPGSADIAAQADVVLAVGTELAEVDLWRAELGHTGTLIRIDCDPAVLGGAPRADIALAGDAGALLAALADAVAPKSTGGWDAAMVVATRARWRAEIDAERPQILPVADVIKAALPDGTMIYSDMTQFAYAAKEVWDMDRPGHWHHPTGFGTLGYALPAAIGGAVARRGLPTMAIAGDYGFQYTVQELMTAVELGLPLPIVVWDNTKLGEIEASMVAAQIPPTAVVQRNPDFLALARAYGAAACEPGSLGALQDALRAAFAAEGPTLIRVTPEIT